MKKAYQQPMTVCSMMEPRTILCASSKGFINVNNSTVGSGTYGD